MERAAPQEPIMSRGLEWRSAVTWGKGARVGGGEWTPWPSLPAFWSPTIFPLAKPREKSEDWKLLYTFFPLGSELGARIGWRVAPERQIEDTQHRYTANRLQRKEGSSAPQPAWRIGLHLKLLLTTQGSIQRCKKKNFCFFVILWKGYVFYSSQSIENISHHQSLGLGIPSTP